MISNRIMYKLLCISILQLPVGIVNYASTTSLPVSGEEYIQIVEAQKHVPNSNNAQTTVQTVIKNVNFNKPDTVDLHMNFYSQAPTGNWDMPFQEACEEMSALLVQYYYQQREPTLQVVEEDIKALTSYTEAHGYNTSINIVDLQTVIRNYFSLESQVLNDPSIEIVKQIIDAGYPVIIPAAGRMLHNPYFTGIGPAYHMLVISGYTDADFIVQEIGTNRGANYHYNQKLLYNAIHDWTGNEDTIQTGVKKILVLKPL